MDVTFSSPSSSQGELSSAESSFLFPVPVFVFDLGVPGEGEKVL